MAQLQDILANILESFPVAELSTDEQRQTFLGIKNRLLSTADVPEELKTLFKVDGFSDFAAGLLWVVDRSARTPEVSGISMEDETLLLASFRRALGEQVEMPPPGARTRGEEGGGAELALATALERFAEAVQGGTDDREMFHVGLLGIADGPDLQAVGGDAAQLASLLADFLKYISDNQLFDDIRVINILSNLSSSVSHWANTSPDSRSGLLEESVSLLRVFRSQFE